jgi:7,8-dihydroneopterin aldolase/epimerase/oxygenase
MSDVIRITGLRLHGHHGVFDSEKADGQPFIVDLAIEVAGMTAGESDSLSDTVDYSEVVALVAGIVTGDPVDLIETLAYRIGEAVSVRSGVQAVTVTVHKPQAPLDYPVEDVSFTTRIVGSGVKR